MIDLLPVTGDSAIDLDVSFGCISGREQARCATSGRRMQCVTQRGPILASKRNRTAMGVVAPCGATRTSLSFL